MNSLGSVTPPLPPPPPPPPPPAVAAGQDRRKRRRNDVVEYKETVLGVVVTAKDRCVPFQYCFTTWPTSNSFDKMVDSLQYLLILSTS